MNKETKNIYNAICHFTAFSIPEISDNFFRKIINIIDLSNITDREYFHNVRLGKYIDHNRLSKTQLIRLATQDPQIINKINIDKFKFRISELEHFLKRWPEYISIFTFDLNKINSTDLLILLKIDIKYAELVNFNKIQFNKIEISELIKQYYFNDTIIRKLIDSETVVLDNFNIRSIILKTDTKYIKSLNLNKLNKLDWYAILEKKPHLFPECNLEIFESTDCFVLTKLIEYIPEIESLIFKNVHKISNLGWENLLEFNFDKYYPLCDFQKLSGKTKKKFQQKLDALRI